MQTRCVHRLGATVYGNNDIYSHIKTFKSNLKPEYVLALLSQFHLLNHLDSEKIYFVKCDVQSCFDTITQDKLLEVIKNVLQDVSDWFPSFKVLIPSTEGICYAAICQCGACSGQDPQSPQTSRLLTLYEHDSLNARCLTSFRVRRKLCSLRRASREASPQFHHDRSDRFSAC